MIKEKTGRVTFMPLNRLNPRPVQFPNAPNVEPLITKLRYDAGHAKAFEQVFGKTCVCKDLHVAAAYVRSHNLNTITTDGDKVDRKGALTGGFHDVRRSRIEAIKNVKSWSEKYEAESKRLAEVKSEIIRIDQEITRVLGRVQLLSTQKNSLLTSREPLANQYAELQREQDTLGEKIARLEAAQAEQEADLSGMKGRRAGYEKEIGTPIVSNLSSAEMRELESLAKEVDQRKTVLLELTKSKSDVSDLVSDRCARRGDLICAVHSLVARRAGLRSSLTKAYDDEGRS